ncbi:unnamed protein product [Colias eurytheme]|nr:unnamed protein product [Colias eurytheme]
MVKWLDNKPVLIASTYVGLEPMGICNRYSKDAKRFIDIPCPKIISEYNKHMGGVDLSDMLIAIYRTYYKAHKWYMAIFSQLLYISVNNAWLLYRREYGLLMTDNQYKNKFMFHLVYHHINDLFPDATFFAWNYSEPGHGKGAPDSVGGTLKRTADKAVAEGKDIVNLKSLKEILFLNFC